MTVASGDLTTRLQEAAAAAIADVMPSIAPDPRRIRRVTIELDMANTCEVKGGRAWIERTVNVNRLLGLTGGPK